MFAPQEYLAQRYSHLNPPAIFRRFFERFDAESPAYLAGVNSTVVTNNLTEARLFLRFLLLGETVPR